MADRSWESPAFRPAEDVNLHRYREFNASKGTAAQSHGFQPPGAWDLFPHQQATLQFACEKGRSAAFLDTGLGKSRVEAAAAAEFAAAIGRPSLILTPLAVARQMVRECAAVGIDALRRELKPGEGMNELLKRIIADRIHSAATTP